MMRKQTHILYLFMMIFLFTACEEDITIDIPQGDEMLVVEGHIEQGRPPIVLLTRTMPYFSSTASSDFDNIFVSGASISVSDGSNTFDLIEINFNNLPDTLLKMLTDLLQLNLSEIEGFNYIIYTNPSILGEVGKQYTLTIDKDQHHLSAVTTIPHLVVPDSMWTEPHDDPNNDSLLFIGFSFQDPPDENNFYRFFTQRNDEPFYTNLFFSLADDKLQNGQKILLPLLRGDSKFVPYDPITFGAFKIGDTVTMKFCAIDEAHYTFWSTIASEQFSGGPFANPVQITSNVVGGRGVWGGYGAYYKKFVVEK